MLDNGWDMVLEVTNAVVSFCLVMTFCVFTYYDEYNPYNPDEVKIP